MSSNVVRVRVKINDNEVEIEAPLIDFKQTVALLPEMIGSLPSGLRATKTQLVQGESEQIQGSEVPQIKLEKGESLADIITKGFADTWGRKPRKLNEVREVLVSYGLIYPKQSVAVALLRLAQSGRLRRFKGQDEEFVYTASTATIASGTATQKVNSDVVIERSGGS